MEEVEKLQLQNVLFYKEFQKKLLSLFLSKVIEISKTKLKRGALHINDLWLICL